MPWSDYLRLCRYWAGHPPLRDMVQAFLKIKPAQGAGVPGPDPEGSDPGVTIAALKRAFPAGRL
jgi:hypothetical protein